jgi:hypothetical protein
MGAGVKRELELGAACLAGSFVVVVAFVLSSDIHPASYAMVTVAVIGAILCDGVRFYREKAIVAREEVRVAGSLRPARQVLTGCSQQRPRRPAGPTMLGR